MRKFCGKPVYKGTAVGPAVVFKKRERTVERTQTENTETELARIERAKNESLQQIQNLYKNALEKVGEDGAAIFEVHQMLLEDPGCLEAVRNKIIKEKVTAEYAVFAAGDCLFKKFANMDDAYLRERAADIRDIFERLLHSLNGTEEEAFAPAEPSILVADDIRPSEILQMDQKKLLGLVTVHGSPCSHTAILARMRKLPALVGVSMNLEEISAGVQTVVDGWNGTVVFEPSEELCAKADLRMRKERETAALFLDFKGKETVTKNGRKLPVYANIGSIEDLEAVLENDAEGIGLFRSEFLYLEKSKLPTEEEQFQAYRQVLQTMGEKKTVIRTLDIGADKQAEYLPLQREENPALGYRAIRICLKQPEIFKTQLRALFRAAVFGNLSILYPMITAAEEVLQIRAIAREAENELKEAGISYKIPKQGIMIETPAAVMISEELAQLADFFSIGTNDLTQYTLAVDRENENLAEFYRPHHKAILKMIQMTAESAHRFGKRVGICGELGADLELTEEFVRMGIDELSVAPSEILKLRKRIREIC